MPSGGHARSGPAPQEGSARSDGRGFRLTALPAAGYDGEIPEWPIIPEASEVEAQYWERAWRTPQACIWARQEWAWLTADVARWVRLSVRCDDPDASAALLGRMPSIEDKVGMTTAGLARMGAKIAADELGDKRTEKTVTGPAEKPARRLRSADAQ